VQRKIKPTASFQQKWEKKGDFNKINYHPLIKNYRKLQYNSMLISSNIHEISLQNQNCNIHIRFLMPNKNVSQKLFKLLETNSLVARNQYYPGTLILSVIIQNLSFLEKLLNIAAITENSINDIRSDIIDTAKPYLSNKSPTLREWIKEGDFTIYPSFCGPDVQRTLLYTNINSGKIKSAQLFGDKDNISIKLRLEIDDATQKTLQDVLEKKYHYSKSAYTYEAFYDYIVIMIQDETHLKNVLTAATEIDSSIQYIINDLINGYQLKDISKTETAFRMGLHDRLGQHSPIQKAFKEHKIAEPKLVDSIFSFLFPPPKKSEPLPSQKEIMKRKR
jgi:hypothetical protein